MIFVVTVLSFTGRELMPHTLTKSPAVCHPKVRNLGSRWVRDRVARRRRKVALESDGWSSSTDIVFKALDLREKSRLGERLA